MSVHPLTLLPKMKGLKMDPLPHKTPQTVIF